MAIQAAIQTTPKRPTKERFASGKLKPKVERGRDRGTAVRETGGCVICGERGGGNFTSMSDFFGTPSAFHANSVDRAGKQLYSCETTFKEEIKRLGIQAQEEKRQDDLLEAAERKYGGQPPPEVAEVLRSSSRNAKSQRDIYDCSVPGCRRFFDSQAALDGHRGRHKGAPAG